MYHKYIPNHIMRDLRERLGVEPDDESRDKYINSMTSHEILNEWLCYQGIIGYTDKIIDVIETAYGVNLRD